jgi:hypothetical protein
MLDFLVEQRLQDAVSRGELDNLPGAGRPLELDDDPLVPEEVRMAHRILKNAGFVPSEVEQLKDSGKLDVLKVRLETRYYQKALAKLRAGRQAG